MRQRRRPTVVNGPGRGLRLTLALARIQGHDLESLGNAILERQALVSCGLTSHHPSNVASYSILQNHP